MPRLELRGGLGGEGASEREGGDGSESSTLQDRVIVHRKNVETLIDSGRIYPHKFSGSFSGLFLAVAYFYLLTTIKCIHVRPMP